MINKLALRNRLLSLAFWANPVVKRDLTVQLRGAKSYWFQGIYLLLLGILCIAGYSMATLGGAEINIVSMSYQLQQFYYFIYVTLAALICMIAPALTAASITAERQRLTLDLLTTTPMTASELLVGKLLSSTAFLTLLLVLSIPASALCIILGGATIIDLLKVYLLIALDGLVLASIGLYFSATTRTSIQSIVWTYAVVIGFVIGTLALATSYGVGFVRSGHHADIAAAIAGLNPFGAVFVGTFMCDIVTPWWGTITVPVWIPSAIIALLFIRLLVTAATYRLGGYGGNPAGSLRRQLLFIIVIVAVMAGSALPSSTPQTSYGEVTVLLFGAAFALFLPALFVPVAPPDSAPGTAVCGRFDLRRLFRPVHGSSLAYFTVALLAGTVALYLAMPSMSSMHKATIAPWEDNSSSVVVYMIQALIGRVAPWAHRMANSEYGMVVLTAIYVWSFGFFVWSAARRAGTWLKDTSAARALTFAVVTAIAVLPCAILSFGDISWDKNDWQLLWVFVPILHLGPQEPDYLLCATFLCMVMGVIFYPFWVNVIPGGRPKVTRAKAAVPPAGAVTT